MVDVNGECDSQACPFHTTENLGLVIEGHPDTCFFNENGTPRLFSEAKGNSSPTFREPKPKSTSIKF